MEVASKEEANARLQATRIEEVAALATDIKGLKVKYYFSFYTFLGHAKSFPGA